MQTRRYARTDSHMHAQGHPGRLKDRSCWTHPHGDKGKGRLRPHRGAPRGGTHPRETGRGADSRTGSHGDAVTHRGQGGVSVNHIKKKKKGSLSHACMNTGQLHAATRYKRPCHSRAHTCSREPSHTEHYRPPARWLSLRQSKPWLHINTCIHNVATSILLDYYYCGSPRLLPRKLNVFA